MTTYRILTAEQWGMRWARPPAHEDVPDAECYVHHTAGRRLSSDAAEAFRQINEMAIREGYSAIDYDLLVHHDKASDVCTIGEARGRALSAATRHRNEEGEAVCLMGYFHPGHSLSERPQPAELEGVARAIVHGMSKGWISHNAQILGHRDNLHYSAGQPTACPGDYLYAKLPAIRARVAELLAPEPTPAPSTPVEASMIPVVAKVSDGPFLACFGHMTGALTMGNDGHQVTPEYVFGRGRGYAYCLNTRRVVSYSVDDDGSWAAVKANTTTAAARAAMGG